MNRAAGIDSTAGVDGVGGNAGPGRGNSIHAATLWAIGAVVVAIIVNLCKLVGFMTWIKDTEDTLLWLSSLFERVLTDESPDGGCYAVDLTKWAFIVPMLICAFIGMGICIGYAARAEIGRAQVSLQRSSSDVFRRVRVHAEESLQRASSYPFCLVWVAVRWFRNMHHPAAEAGVELEG